MKMFVDVPVVFLHQAPIDFRKSINGLVLIVETQMQMSPFDDAVFLFTNSTYDKIKLLYWDGNGFVLFYKRLEQTRFIWPTLSKNEHISLSEQELQQLLAGDTSSPWQQLDTSNIEL